MLGITPSSITTLHTMAAQAVEAAPPGSTAEAHPAFAQILGRFRRGGSDDHAR